MTIMNKDQFIDRITTNLSLRHDRLERKLHCLSAKMSGLVSGDATPLNTIRSASDRVSPPSGSQPSTGAGKPSEEVCGLLPQPQSEQSYLEDLLGHDSDVMRRQREQIVALSIGHCRLRRTSGDYYNWSLEQRRAYLGAPSVACLCKSMLMVNKRAPVFDDYRILIGITPPIISLSTFCEMQQYEVKFVNEKLIDHFRSTAPPPMPPKKRYNFRVASEEENDRLSGFVHNAVSPLGFRHMQIPFVLDRRVVDTVDMIWLGGGEPNVKFAIGVSEFISVFNPIIASATVEGQDS